MHIDVGITKSGWDSAVSERGGGVAVPPVVARIFVGVSTSPLTREAGALCEARVFCPFTMIVGMERFGATGGASKAWMP